MINDIQVGALVVLIIAICQAIKIAGLNTRYIPVIAIILGLAGSFYFSDSINWLTTVAGLITAFTASGIFSGFKATVLNK